MRKRSTTTWPRVQPERMQILLAAETELLRLKEGNEANLRPQRPITEERQPTYGHPALNFVRAAIMLNGLWANKLCRELTAEDIALGMAVVKLARLEQTPTHEDTITDVGGYMSCLEQVNGVRKFEGQGEGTGLVYGTLAEKHYNPDSIRGPK